MLAIFNVSSKWTQVIYLRKASRLVIKSVNKSNYSIEHRPFQSSSRFFSICKFFSPSPTLFLVLFHLIAVNFLGRVARTGWWSLKIIMIILVVTCTVSRGCFARPFSSFLLVWKGKEGSCSFLLCRAHKESPRWSSNPTRTSLLLCSSRSWRAQDVDNEEIFRLIHVDRICVAFHRQSRKS